MEGALTLATKVLTSGKTDDYLAINWSSMRFQHMMLLQTPLEVYLYIKKGKNEIKVLGKGNKERMVPIADNVLVAFNDWINIRGKSDGSLFNPINKGDNLKMRVGISSTKIFNIIDRRRIEADVSKIYTSRLAPVDDHRFD